MRLSRLIQVCVLLVGSAAVAAPTRVFPGARWEETTLESQGVDAKKLEAATRLLAATVGSSGVQELVIIRHGRMIWKGDGIDSRRSSPGKPWPTTPWRGRSPTLPKPTRSCRSNTATAGGYEQGAMNCE